MAVAAVAFFARLSEASLAEVDKGMIEAAFASGAGKLRTMFCIVLPEAHVPLVKDITITAISLLGFSAMAGLVGGGGLGDLAYRYGYQRYNMGIMIACIAVLVCWFRSSRQQETGTSTASSGDARKSKHSETGGGCAGRNGGGALDAPRPRSRF